ncbi:tRNA (guanine(6)-N(2))-methyltransferase THUMP3 isoform X1 [Lepeophtheirus salmonis]
MVKIGHHSFFQEENIKFLVEGIEKYLWKKGLAAWRRVFPSSPEHISFRCTCYRSGENHNFASVDVAKAVGGAINDKFNWDVKMKGFDLEVVVNIDVEQVYCTLSLNKVSLFKRNIEHFGPTTLRATICSSLLRYAEITLGDIVVDPMCGGGSIPLEGALGYSQGFHLGGEIHEKAIERTRLNLQASREAQKNNLGIDVCKWDVTQIPLRDNSVDVFVTDLPFGKRSGSRTNNAMLYPKVMLSMARVVRPTTGRAVLLTQDRTSIFKALKKINPYWKLTRQSSANIGGLTALIFFFKRTSNTL